MTDLALRRVDEVVQREVAGETFLVPIHGHLADMRELFVLNEVGSWLWGRLDGRHVLEDLVAGVVTEFEVDEMQARADTESFLQQLSNASLLEGAGVSEE